MAGQEGRSEGTFSVASFGASACTRCNSKAGELYGRCGGVHKQKEKREGKETTEKKGPRPKIKVPTTKIKTKTRGRRREDEDVKTKIK
jgi:hypothetical protein